MEKKKKKKEEKEKFPLCVKAQVIGPFGTAAQKEDRKHKRGIRGSWSMKEDPDNGFIIK